MGPCDWGSFQSGPTAIQTRLGWVLSGPIAGGTLSSCSTNLVMTHMLRVDTQTDTLDEGRRAFWELESLGIQEKTPYNDPGSSLQFREGKYEVSLPWKQFHPPLPDNYNLSQQRLHGLLRGLHQNPDLLQKYDRIIQEQIEKGVVEDAPVFEANLTRLHYLPQSAVTKTRLRYV